MTFLGYYLYGHLNGLGGLSQPRELFVAAIGGKEASEPKAFHPILDFAGKDITQIEADLKRWFPPTDTLTDFNVLDRKSTRLNSSHLVISYAVFCLKKKKKHHITAYTVMSRPLSHPSRTCST